MRSEQYKRQREELVTTELAGRGIGDGMRGWPEKAPFDAIGAVE